MNETVFFKADALNSSVALYRRKKITNLLKNFGIKSFRCL